jgi:hypothetical protein
MPKRRIQDINPYQPAIDFNSPDPEPEPAAPPIPAVPENAAADNVSEPTPEYNVAPAWVDTAGRTRTWSLLESGTKLAECTTKSGAQKIADLLNGAERTGRIRSK